MMNGWHAERTPGRSAEAVIAVTLLALLLLTAVPVALLAAASTPSVRSAMVLRAHPPP